MIEVKTTVLEDLCRREGEAMIVVVKAATTDGTLAHDSLNAEEAKTMAVNHAALKGAVSVPRMEDTPLIYPVDGKNEVINDPATQKLAAFVAEYRVAPRLV